MKKHLAFTLLALVLASCGSSKKTNTFEDPLKNPNNENQPALVADEGNGFTEYASLDERLDMIQEQLTAYGIHIQTKETWKTLGDLAIVNRRGKHKKRILRRHANGPIKKKCLAKNDLTTYDLDAYGFDANRRKVCSKQPLKPVCRKKPWKKRCEVKRWYVPTTAACDDLERVEAKVEFFATALSDNDIAKIEALINDYIKYADQYYEYNYSQLNEHCISSMQSRMIANELQEFRDNVLYNTSSANHVEYTTQESQPTSTCHNSLCNSF